MTDIRTKLESEGNPNQMSQSERNIVYQIRVKGHMDNWLSDYFEGLTVSHQQDGTTIVTVGIADQAGLRGLLNLMFGRNYELLFLKRVEVGNEQGSS